MDDLPLQVRLVDGVELDDTDGADAGGGRVTVSGPQAAGTDDQHLGVLEALLPVHPNPG